MCFNSLAILAESWRIAQREDAPSPGLATLIGSHLTDARFSQRLIGMGNAAPAHWSLFLVKVSAHLGGPARQEALAMAATLAYKAGLSPSGLNQARISSDGPGPERTPEPHTNRAGAA